MKRATLESQLGACHERIAILEDTIVSLRTTLAYYADPLNYDAMLAPGTLDPQQGTWHVDGGERARAALERKSE